MPVYPLALLLASVGVALAERVRPWRPEQKTLRRWLWSDLLHLVFNGHFLGLLIAGTAALYVLPPLDAWLMERGLLAPLYRNAAASWPLWVQIPVALVVVDFVQWCVHNALHRVPWLWSWHKVHHSVVDGEMDWIVSFRFQWTEVVLYKAVLYLPLMWFGFAGEALLFHAVFGTIIGHLNHANLHLTWGPLRYVLNSPAMHIWHHDYDAVGAGKNFGIIFSTWDWLFGTAYMPDQPPRKLGYPGVEEVPHDFFGQTVWQLGRWVPALGRHHLAMGVLGVAALAGAFLLQRAPAPETPMLGEQAAASQPAARRGAGVEHAATPAAATSNLARFGAEARAAGLKHPEWTVSARELAAALGSPRLVLLDVRPAERVEAGRIPSAQPIDRGDYSHGQPAPGVSRPVADLEATLRARGVGKDSVVVVYGDGGPEPYRLWWTLRVTAGYDVRVLDGGLPAWKALGEAVAGGAPLSVAAGDVALTARPARDALLWDDLAALRAKHPDLKLVDTRTFREFTGEEQHKKAARAGHIPGATHLDWLDLLRDPTRDPRLKATADLKALLAPYLGGAPVVTYCQSGTRSSTLYFALLQLGLDEAKLWNYDGSWAEYSRLEALPVELGARVARAEEG